MTIATQATSGTENWQYNLVSVSYHSREGATTDVQYIAEAKGADHVLTTRNWLGCSN